MKDDTFTFTIVFEKEQPFSFTENYKGELKDDRGYRVQFRGVAILISSSSYISKFEIEKYPYSYTFEIVR